MDKYQKVCVVGLGYIGLPTASLLATKGFNVIGVDVSQKVVDTINRGEIHIVEPDLDILVKSAVKAAREVNHSKPQWVINRVRGCADRFKPPIVEGLGLAFKADVDDLRESSALDTGQLYSYSMHNPYLTRGL